MAAGPDSGNSELFELNIARKRNNVLLLLTQRRGAFWLQCPKTIDVFYHQELYTATKKRSSSNYKAGYILIDRWQQREFFGAGDVR